MKFKELAVGNKFIIDGKKYIKTKKIGASCCREAYNCRGAESSNSKERKMLDDKTEVEKVN